MSYKITYHETSAGNPVLQYKGDAQGLVDHCASYAQGMRDLTRTQRERAAIGIGLRKVLSVDPIVAMDVAKKRGMDCFNPDLWREFMDRDYSKFRTSDDRTVYQRHSTRKRFVKLGS